MLYLIENRDRIVPRRELLEKFWDGRDVYDEAVTKCVGAIRKALNEQHENPRFIETRWAGGYRFAGRIEEPPLFQSSVVEIEKSREVRIVFEEMVENGDLARAAACELTGATANSALIAQQSDPSVFRSKPAPRIPALRRMLALASAVCTVLIVAAVAFISSSYQKRPAPIASIAVLPLRDLSPGTNNEVLADGISESLISSLSKIDGLKVVSRNSVSAFKDQDADTREIGRRLGVESFLEGSVSESGGRIRARIRLVRSENGEVLWSSDDYDRASVDILQIQDDLARSVATRLRLKLTAADQEKLAKRQTNNIDAYQAYVKGRYFWKKKDASNLEKARKFFEEAIRLDPNYAAAYTGLADYYLTGVWYADFSPEASLKKAKELFLTVSGIDDQLPDVHSARARIAAAEWDWETCRKEFERAIELNPNEANYWQGYAFVLRNLDGNYAEAVNAIRRAQELDPLSPSINTDVGVMLTHAGRYDEAIKAFERTLEIDPQFFDAFWNLGLAYERKRMFDEAAAAFIESERLKGKDDERLAAYRAAYEQGNMKGFWQKWLEFLLADVNGKNVPAYVIATGYARSGDNETAFKWLEKSFAAREPNLVNLKIDFAFDSLRADSRFADLLGRVGLEK